MLAWTTHSSEDCKGGSCIDIGTNEYVGDIINGSNFNCTFNNLDDRTRQLRLDGLKKANYTPQNMDEAAEGKVTKPQCQIIGSLLS